MKRNTLVLFFSLMLMVVVPCGPIDAEPQDSLQKTLDLLKTRLESSLSYSLAEGQGPEVGTATFEAVSFESCRIAWKSSSEVGQHPDVPPVLRNARIVNHASVELSAIDPDRTRINTIQEMIKRNLPRALVLELKIRPGSPGFKKELEITANGRVTKNVVEEKSYSFFFNTNDRSIADEVSKAFAEASNICRSRMKRPAED